MITTLLVGDHRADPHDRWQQRLLIAAAKGIQGIGWLPAKPVRRVSRKRPDVRLRFPVFRFYEAAARDLRQSAKMRQSAALDKGTTPTPKAVTRCPMLNSDSRWALMQAPDPAAKAPLSPSVTHLASTIQPVVLSGLHVGPTHCNDKSLPISPKYCSRRAQRSRCLFRVTGEAVADEFPTV